MFVNFKDIDCADEEFDIAAHDGTTLRLGRAYRARLTERWQGR